jgi:cephalosporin hydroxylase
MMRTFLTFSCAVIFTFVGLGLYQQAERPGAAGPFSLTPVAQAKGEAANRRQLIDDFLRLWTSPFERTVFKNRWLGIETLQNPNDVWVTQEILFDVKPDFLVEAGTRHGGSAAIWAMILEQINPEARVITIDIEDQVTEAKELDIFRRKVDFLVGSSTDPKIVADVKRRTQGKKVVVLLDSAHTKDHVLNELKIYSPLVGVGSYVIVQDTVVNGHPIWPEWGPGPYEAVEEFLAGNDQFEPDRDRERLLVTLCRKGFLKRIK